MNRKHQNSLLSLIFSGTFLLFGKEAGAAQTYFVRTDGGTAAQCTGLADAAYSGSGTGQACALSHPFWLLRPNGTGGLSGTALLRGGDTVIIASGSYMIGIGAPNSTACAEAWAYGCSLPPIPSGPDAQHPTKIYGRDWDTKSAPPPEIWGFGRLDRIISLQGSSNVELRYLDLTDHSPCIFNSPDPAKRCQYAAPYNNPTAQVGLRAADSRNVLLKDLTIHGLAVGIHAGRLADWTLDGVVIRGNSSAGWDGDIGHGAIGSGGESSDSGTLHFKNSKVIYSGCGERYPGVDIYGCFSQDQGGYGDGIGTYFTDGNWIFENTEISHNTSDGLDLLYHTGNGTITIKRSRFEGNAGNAVKVAADVAIENSILISNCDYFDHNPIAEQGGDPTYHTQAGFNNCRAAGTALVTAKWKPGRFAAIANSLITGTSTILIEAGGDSCDGTERFISRNNIFLGMEVWFKKTHGEPGIKPALFYLDGSDGNGAGPCGPSDAPRKIKFENAHSIAYNLKVNQCPNTTGILCLDPLLTAIPPLSGANAIYTYGERWNVLPQPTSPAVDKPSQAAGTPLIGPLLIPGVDILGNGRPSGTGIDWGPYEAGAVERTAPAAPANLREAAPTVSS